MNDIIKEKKTAKTELDTRLDEYSNKILFPEKLKKANAILDKVGLPKQFENRKDHAEIVVFLSFTNKVDENKINEFKEYVNRYFSDELESMVIENR